MGIAIAVVYLPLYIVFSIIAVISARGINKSIKEPEFTDKFIFKRKAVGFMIAIIVTWILIWLVPVKGNTDFEALFIQLGLTLAGPAVLVLVVSILFSKSNTRKYFSVGALLSTVVIPWITLLAATNYYNVINYPAYWYKCANAEVVFIKDVKPSKSVFIQKDSFTSARKGYQSETRSIGLFLLNQSKLEYIERPIKKENARNNPIYERISIQGDRVFRSNGGKKTKYIIEEVEEITSEYEVKHSRLDFLNEKEDGIGGSRIEIYDRKDNELIAHAQYYWDNKTFKSCPDEAHQGLFVYKFIATALNVISRDSGIKGLRQ
ncbi:MAG: hypothetical protein N0C84_06315 [Candidatus Thiodiazotropha taylori]|uniref:Uncharacterized protein n=1 Tax=Candidatus Thiodiazotropha taylori TaxID=2792791 RepID=A0A9E4KB93_9GAMM|nr:hypothetical protein [Candidatus Thiodiazotropha taylori]MCW4256068.1 hypothetical protein [Candidatus Thiodiazotropha taylori]